MSTQTNVTPPRGITLQEDKTHHAIIIRPPSQIRGIPLFQGGFIFMWLSLLIFGLAMLFQIWLLLACIPLLGGIMLLALLRYVFYSQINRTFLTLAGQTLTVKTGLIFASTQQFETAKMQHIYCTRELKDGSVPTADYYLELSPVGRLKNLTTDPQQLAYLVGKLRHDLKLPETPITGEYIPAILGQANGASLSYESMMAHLAFLLWNFFFVALFTFGINALIGIQVLYLLGIGGPFILLGIGGLLMVGLVINMASGIWQAYQLNQHGQIITGVVAAKKRRTYYNRGAKVQPCEIYYRYLEYETWLVVSAEVFAEIIEGQPIEVCYLPTQPNLSRPHPLEKYCGKFAYLMFFN